MGKKWEPLTQVNNRFSELKKFQEQVLANRSDPITGWKQKNCVFISVYIVNSATSTLGLTENNDSIHVVTATSNPEA